MFFADLDHLRDGVDKLGVLHLSRHAQRDG